MKKLITLLLLSMFANSCTPVKENHERHLNFSFEDSEFIDTKIYRVYLPPSYFESDERFPVLYMMDGQNLFIDSAAYGGVSWNFDKIADSLFKAGTIQEFILVGVNHGSEKRFSEYLPQKPVSKFPKEVLDTVRFLKEYPVYSDDYLQFLVKELKPLIDKNYRTIPDTEHTYIGGSSMGGLISMYATCEYPSVFGTALCFSTHWSVALDNSTPELGFAIVDYFEENVPANKKWYFDHGTRGLDAFYGTYQSKIDSIMIDKGYIMDKNWISRVYEGHDHNELYWNKRLSTPLIFAFKK